MKTKIGLLFGVIAFSVIILLDGCANHEISEINEVEDSTSVSLAFAEYVATNFDMNYSANNRRRIPAKTVKKSVYLEYNGR